jgi:Fic family protein
VTDASVRSVPSAAAAADPLARIAALPDVPDAVLSARAAVDRLLGHRILRRRGAAVSAESALRGARASAALEGRAFGLRDVRAGAVTDPIVQGALRVSAETGLLAETWRQAPRQVLARLHVLAAADVVEAARLGRPRAVDQDATATGAPTTGPTTAAAATATNAAGAAVAAVNDAFGLGPPPAPGEVTVRLDAMFDLLMRDTEAPAIVVGAIVHGELLSLRPFGRCDGIVARAAQRVTFIARGLDPRSLVAPDVGHAELGDAYAEALRGYVAGTPAGVAGWVRHCADAVSVAARDSLAFCEALHRG